MSQHEDHHRQDWYRVITSKSDYESMRDHSQSAVQVLSWTQLRVQLRHNPDGLDLIKVLQLTRTAEATDKRDKVYSILGLLKRSDRDAIRIDYSDRNSVLHVYTDIAKHCIGTPNAIRLLHHAGTLSIVSNLPSWAPDWSIYPRYPLDDCLYQSAGQTNPQTALSPDGRKLHLPGLTFDKIMVLGIPVSYPHATMNTGIGVVTDELLIIGLEETDSA